jgi:hypothetical protein
MAEMTPLGEGASEYVNLTPTTGPVPLMVPAEQLRRAAEPEPEEPTVDEIVADVAAETEPEVEDEPVAADLEEEVDDTDDTDVEVAELYDVEQEAPDIDAATVVEDVVEVEVDDVVELDIEPAADLADEDDTDDEGTIAPVVSLFGGDTGPSPAEVSATVEAAVEPAVEAEAAPSKGSVDDLFAKLRAARTETVAERTRQPEPDADAALEVEAALAAESLDDTVTVTVDATEELSVFQATPSAPATQVEYDDTPFGRRDAELTPLIVAAARKLKRVLADEQNDVLHSLRNAKAVRSLADLLPGEAEHVLHYAGAIHDELVAAAVAGAASIDDGSAKEHTKAVTKGSALEPAVKAIESSIVQPLRDRLERAVADADGDATDLTATIRAVYREWKNQRIDEHLDDIAQLAFGRGALVALAPGTPVCWTVDPNGPDCPDAEDNALAGVVKAGDPFPTDHVCAPAHEGCRCMLQRAPL